jgi:hypothetical protein
MPGAWEIRQQNLVLAAVLHTDLTSIAWSFGIRNLQIPGQLIGLAGMPYDMARNTACMRCLEIGAENIFFLDSDVVPPHDAILRLLAHRMPVVSGMYCRRSHPAGYPVMMRGGQWITQFEPNSMVEADVVGAGCLLIHRSVLEAMQPSDAARGRHWFDWKVDMQSILPPGEAMSEDFVFCKNARQQLGIKIMVDTSIHCRHVGLAQATYGQFMPCDAVPVT